MSLKVFGAKGSSLTKLCNVMCRYVGTGSDNPGTAFGGTALLKFGKAKIGQN